MTGRQIVDGGARTARAMRAVGGAAHTADVARPERLVRLARLVRLVRLVALAGVVSFACAPAKLDGFLYDPLKAPAGGYQLSTAVIPAPEELHIVTPDGQTLQGYFIAAAAGSARPDVTIIYFHGQSNDVGTTWPRLEYLYPLGYNLVAVDGRGYGLSTGSPDEPGLDIDVRAIWDSVTARPDVTSGHVAIYGRSFGGALAIELASARPPAALITESAFTSVAALVKDGAYVDLPVSFVARSRWDNLGKIGGVAAPYLALHGTADPYVLPRYSQELTAAHAQAQPDVTTTLVMVPGADHGDVPETMGLDTYRATVRAFVEAAIPSP